jgi:hypothetical protein
VVIDNNNKNEISLSDDDPTLELEPLSAEICAQLADAADAPAGLVAVDETFEAVTETRPPRSEVTLVEFQELQGELTYRIELNSILKLGNDQLREKCDELADQVASLLKKNETLSHELERSRHLVATTKKQRLHARDAKPELLSKLKNQDEAVVVSAVVKQQDGAIEVLRQENLVLTHLVSELEVELDEVRQVSEHAMSKAAEHTSARPVSAARRLPGGDAGDCLVLMGTNGGGSDTWVLDEGIITIGSSANSDIPIESRYVSQHHAQLI